MIKTTELEKNCDWCDFGVEAVYEQLIWYVDCSQCLFSRKDPGGVDESELFGSVWVIGRLSTEYIENKVGVAEYFIEAEKVEPYE